MTIISERAQNLINSYIELNQDMAIFCDTFVKIYSQWSSKGTLEKLEFSFSYDDSDQLILALALRKLSLGVDSKRLLSLNVREIENYLRDNPMESLFSAEKMDTFEHWLALFKQKIMASRFDLRKIGPFSYENSLLVEKVHFFGNVFNVLNELNPEFDFALIHIHDETVVFSHSELVPEEIVTSACVAIQARISSEREDFTINWVAQ